MLAINSALVFSGVADAPETSRCLDALYLSSPHPCFVTGFSLILAVARDLNASRPTN